MQKYIINGIYVLMMFIAFSTTLFAQQKMKLSNAKVFIGHEKEVEYLDFSPSGDRIASAGHDNLIHIWSVFTDDEVKTLTGHSALVNHVAFSKNGKLLASASDDGTVKIWDLGTGVAIKTILNAPAYALFKAGVLQAWDEKDRVCLSDLSQRFKANEGYLNVALRVLCAQGWLVQHLNNEEDTIDYSVTPKGKIAFRYVEKYKMVVDFIPYAIKMEGYIVNGFEAKAFEKLQKQMLLMAKSKNLLPIN